MDQNNLEKESTYKIVINHEEQYSIWPVSRKNALGGKILTNKALKKNV